MKMAESQQYDDDILDMVPATYDPNVYLYDPRRRRHSYRPRRHRSRGRRSARRRYDPQFRGFRIRRRRGGRGGGKGMGKLWKMINGALPPIAGVAAFFSASSVLADYNNQVARGQLGGASFQDKLKWIIGMATYRAGQALGQNWNIFGTTGLFQFPVQVTTGTGFNPWKAINGITIGSGIALAAVHFIPGLPRRGTIKKVATATLIGGILGGVLDPVAGNQARGSPGVLASSGPARQGATPLATAYGGGRTAQAAPQQIAGTATVG